MRIVCSSPGRLKPGSMGVQRAEGSNHQSRGDQQDERHRKLRGDENGSRSMTFAAVACRASARAERRGDSRPRVPQRWDQAEQDAREQ
ncbi:MAG TPA: hypothetical protein VIX63_10270 [Vicinamibacterales bacterium]